jgi:hypothetical protein
VQSHVNELQAQLAEEAEAHRTTTRKFELFKRDQAEVIAGMKETEQQLIQQIQDQDAQINELDLTVAKYEASGEALKSKLSTHEVELEQRRTTLLKQASMLRLADREREALERLKLEQASQIEKLQTTTTSSVVVSGYLQMKPLKGILKGLQKRWFSATFVTTHIGETNTHLPASALVDMFYFESDTDTRSKGVIPLELGKTKIESLDQAGLFFDIVGSNGDRIYHLKAETMSDKLMWVSAIHQHLNPPKVHSAGMPKVEGYLVKLNPSGVGSKKRWFFVQNSVLLYSASSDATGPSNILGNIHLEKVQEISSIEGKPVFNVATNGRTYTLQASSVAERDTWIANIHELRAHRLREIAMSSSMSS